MLDCNQLPDRSIECIKPIALCAGLAPWVLKLDLQACRNTNLLLNLMVFPAAIVALGTGAMWL